MIGVGKAVEAFLTREEISDVLWRAPTSGIDGFMHHYCFEECLLVRFYLLVFFLQFVPDIILVGAPAACEAIESSK